MTISGKPFSVDLYTIPLVGYDLILGWNDCALWDRWSGTSTSCP